MLQFHLPYSYGASETLKNSNYIGTPEFSYLKENLEKYLSLINEKIEEPQLE